MKKRVPALIIIFIITPFLLFSPLFFSLQSKSIDRVIGQLIILGFRGHSLTPSNPIYENIRRGRIGGVVLYDYDIKLKKANRNIKSPAQVKKLIGELQNLAIEPLFVAVDEEGGYINNLKSSKGFVDIPSAEKLSALNDLEITEREAAKIGRMLSELGFNLNFAPVVDLKLNPENPIIARYERSFSPDPEIVTLQAAAFIKGLNSTGIISCIKHFPGHGSSQLDSHLELPDLTEYWSKIELLPYSKLIANNRCQLIMRAHTYNAGLDPEYPATLSKETLDRLLRKKMNFAGVIISDDLQMKAISDRYELKEVVKLALNAGVDILLFSNNIEYNPELPLEINEAVKELLAEGEITIFQLYKAYNRIMRVKQEYLKRKRYL